MYPDNLWSGKYLWCVCGMQVFLVVLQWAWQAKTGQCCRIEDRQGTGQLCSVPLKFKVRV